MSFKFFWKGKQGDLSGGSEQTVRSSTALQLLIRQAFMVSSTQTSRCWPATEQVLGVCTAFAQI